MKKTFNIRSDNKCSRGYRLPSTKLRNVSCSHCKHQFFLREFVPLNGLVPLLLECGHVICEKCANVSLHKPCPLCNVVTRLEDAKDSLPLNMYALGLMVVSHNRPMGTEDIDDIGFSRSVISKIKQKNSQGFCHECGIQATIKCPQCNALFCHVCYSKIHGRALQNHSKVILSENHDDSYFTIKNTCSEKCVEPLGYYCEDCDIAGCSHCMLRLHKKHNYLALINKNQELLPEFHKVHERVIESLKRIRQAQKKLKSTALYPTKLQNADSVEAAITQHFAYLHGVLQNTERKIIDTLHEQRDSRNKNIDEISMQMKELEDRFHSALTITASIEGNLDKIDVQQVINKLQKLAEFPCHLVINSVPEDQEIRFNIDESIVDVIEKHCNIEVPAVSSFSLQRRELLPDDYEMEPLTEEINIQRFRTNSSSKVRSMSNESLVSRKNENFLAVDSAERVRVTYIIDPSWFYVQLVRDQSTIAEMNRGLATLANTSGVTPTEVTLNALYVVRSARDRVWYRGRVVEKKTEAKGDEKYNVLFIDYGVTEVNVTLSRMRNILPQFSMTPTLSLRCTLHDVVPNHGKWHPDAIQAFKNLVCTNEMVSMKIKMMTGDTYYVELSVVSSQDSGLISVTESLTYMKYATCVTPNKLLKINPHSTRQYYREQLELECYTDVQILFVETPNCIYVQKAHANRSYFNTLVRDMTDHYERNTHSTDIIPVPCTDLPCAARGADGHWHRGLVREVTENTVKVFYVDLGYTLVLNYDIIRSLPKKFMTCRTQAIKVSLRSIKPLAENGRQWSEKTNDFLKSFLMDKKHFKVIAYEKFGNTYSVAMYTPDRDNVTYLLKKKGLAKSTETSRDVANSRHHKRSKPKKKPSIEETPPEEAYDMMDISTRSKSILEDNNEDPFKVSVMIHHIESPDCIYVSDASCDQSDIDRMMNQMQEFYSKFRSEKRNAWQKGTVCAVFSLKNERYHRGRIVDIKSADKVVVFLYDVGLEETVTMDEIQSLYPPFFKIPTYVFKINLTGILPCGGSTTWPSLSCEELRKTIDNNYNCKFYISKLEQEEVENAAIPVELWIKQIKMDGPLAPTRIEINSVNRMLVEKGVALPVKEYAKKRDKILAVELKRQLMKKLERLSKYEANVKWVKIEDDLDDLAEIDNDASRTILRYSDSNSDDSQNYSSEEIFDNIPSLPKLTTWSQPDIIVEDTFIAVPTYIDHNGYLYLHSIAQNAVTLRKIESKLEKLYKNSTIELCDTVWAAGDMCIAQYHANNKWYRGRVNKVLGNDLVDVEFVDYGNIEECTVGTLKKKVVLENIPIQCTKCLIYSLIPGSENGKWKTEELDKIHSLLIEQECEVTILDRTREHLVVSIMLLPNKYCKEKTDLITFLINELGMDIKVVMDSSMLSEKSASSSSTADVVIENSKSFDSDNETVINDSVITGFSPLLQQSNLDEDEDEDEDEAEDDSSATTDIENLCVHKTKKKVTSSTPYVVSQEDLLNYQLMNIPQDVEYVEIELCASIGPCEFHAQLKENEHSTILNSYYQRFHLLMDELQEYAFKQPHVKSFVPNTPCCARFTDGMWYRCLIEDSNSLPGTDHIEIKLLFVDYGNDEYRTINPKLNEIFILKKEWMELPAMAIRCKLWNIEVAPEIDDSDLVPQLENMYNKRAIATIKEVDEEFTSVELYEDKTRTELTYSALLAEGLFQFKSAKN